LYFSTQIFLKNHHYSIKKTNNMVHEDYLPCGRYEKQASHSEKNFTAFFHEDSQRHFFALLDDAGKVLLKSEGYPQAAARENGIASVIKNRGNADFYSSKNENGKFFISLRAANYREIARSCSVDTEAEALALIPYCTGEQTRGGGMQAEVAAVAAAFVAPIAVEEIAAPAVEIAPVVEEIVAPAVEIAPVVEEIAAPAVEIAPVVEEVVAPIAIAEAAPAVAAVVVEEKERANNKLDDDYLSCREYESGAEGNKGLVKFSHENGLHYFVWMSDEGKVLMRSEGYPTTGARDNGIASVEKNRDLNERYSTVEKMGRYFVILKAGNHQEIARSCPYDSEAAALATYPNARAQTKSHIVEAAVATAIAATVVAPEPEPVVEEVAPVVEAIAPIEVAAPIAAVAAIAAVVETPEPVVEAPKPVVEIVKPVDVEDDYLPCKDYQSRNVSDKVNNVAMFKHDNGLYYFAIYDKEGAVRMRSEGFTTAQNRDKELSGALKNINNPDAYTVVRKGEYFIQILKDKEGKEVGRSCMQKEEPKPIVVPPVAAPIAVAAIAAVAAAIPTPEPVVEKVVVPPPPPKVVVPPPPPPVYEAAAAVEEEVAASGFKWWWLLLPLLALAIWFFTKDGCNKPAAVVAPEIPAATAPVPETTPTPAPTPEAAAPVAAAPSCNLNWILFDFDKAAIRADANKELEDMAAILKEHKDYVGVLRAHTDAVGSSAYNDGLSNRRATNAKDVLVKMGIEGDRIKTSASGKNEAYAKNTNDDTGRKYNRRVELFIQDKDGKEVCKSIPPAVSDGLKAK
jgi:outer membrane protein OmpA-like peptidoglycan-associated protein/uncharacterized protein YegP (UPF0339 family)